MKINNPFFIFIRKDERYMPDKLTALRIKQQDGTYSVQIPVGALAENVAYNNDYNLKTILGNVNMTKGNLQSQIDTKVDYEKLVNGTLGFVTPEMYGAKGDGVTDDRLAIISAIQSGKPVVFNADAVYAVGAAIYPTSGGEFAELYGCGCQIKVIADIDRVFRLTNAARVSSFKINLNSHNAQMGVLVTNGENDVIIEDIEIYGLKDTNTTVGSQMIYINGCDAAYLRNISVHDCTKRGNGTITDAGGTFNGIYATNYKKIIIDGVRIENNHNVDADGNIILEDCEGIYVRNTDEESSTIIQNVFGKNFGKRLIKAQCTSVIIDHIQAFTNSLDYLVAIAILDLETGWGKYAKGIVSNSILVNSYGTSAGQIMIATSEDVLVQNCYIDGGTHNWCIENKGDMKITSCKMYHNGIGNYGRTLDVESVYFSGGVFCAQYSNSSNAISTIIRNCDLYFTQKYGINNDFIRHLFGDASYSWNKIHGYGRVRTDANAGNIEMQDCEFFDVNTGDVIDLHGGTAKIKNLAFHSAQGTTSIRAINLNGAAVVCDADNVTVDSGFNYSFVGSGTLTAKNVDMNKVYANNMTLCYFYPEYYASLPTRAQNGFLCLLTTDGKLYKCTAISPTVAWTAVN